MNFQLERKEEKEIKPGIEVKLGRKVSKGKTNLTKSVGQKSRSLIKFSDFNCFATIRDRELMINLARRALGRNSSVVKLRTTQFSIFLYFLCEYVAAGRVNLYRRGMV